MLRITTTENGKVKGLPAADPRVTAFKGIPFAAPPVGELRWRPPQPAANWEGVRTCYEFAPIPMQDIPGKNPDAFYAREFHVDPDIPMSEDCLYLNVWTPAKKADEKLPVMMWIYGGGSRTGYTAEMEFDGERMARRGVILVSVAYRVNAFGYLANNEIIAESGDGCFGNYGLLDQLEALKWIKRNIAAFGGDPNNVTIFGQSAGAGSVLCHTGSPMSRGYFHKTIAHSGGGLRTFGQGKFFLYLDEAKKVAADFYALLGVTSLAEARKLDAKTVSEAAGKLTGPLIYGPIIDGKFLTMDPTDVILRNEHPDMPYMFGYTGAEYDNLQTGAIKTLDEFEAAAKKIYGERADDFLKLCNVKTDEEARALYTSDDVFLGRCVNSIAFALKQHELGRKNNYCYRFEPTIPGWDNPGAFHSSDLWFAFETLAKCWRPFTGAHYDLARIMCNYWTNFAKTGDPNGNDADGAPMPQWRAFTGDDQFIISLRENITRHEGIMTDLMKFRLDYIADLIRAKDFS
ncbi:MAG: carboxylesterase family protein [Oscillospiraceae bacterium]|jgi:para-nitrobenzyl esterase|nr:carboxylesterase family protein [Oscillospiraceae bacterium]